MFREDLSHSPSVTCSWGLRLALSQPIAAQTNALLQQHTIFDGVAEQCFGSTRFMLSQGARYRQSGKTLTAASHTLPPLLTHSGASWSNWRHAMWSKAAAGRHRRTLHAK